LSKTAIDEKSLELMSQNLSQATLVSDIELCLRKCFLAKLDFISGILKNKSQIVKLKLDLRY
jgi:hypothetical protein